MPPTSSPPPPAVQSPPRTPKTPRTLRRYTKPTLLDTDINHSAHQALRHISHTAEHAMAERDIIRIENNNLRTLLQNIKPRATKRQKLRLTAVLVDNMEVLAAIKAREDEAIKKTRKRKRNEEPDEEEEPEEPEDEPEGEAEPEDEPEGEAEPEEESEEEDHHDCSSDTDSVCSVINVIHG